jgi:hypothetical protein
LEKKVEVNGKTRVVKVIGGYAEFKRGRGGKKLLKIKITAEVDGVRSEYAIIFGRYARNKAEGPPTPAPGRQETERQTPRGSPP